MNEYGYGYKLTVNESEYPMILHITGDVGRLISYMLMFWHGSKLCSLGVVMQGVHWVKTD